MTCNRFAVHSYRVAAGLAMALLATSSLRAQPQELVPHLWQDLDPDGSSSPWILLANDQGFLFAPAAAGGYFIHDLFWTDGTVEGTHLVPRDPDSGCGGVHQGGQPTRDGQGLFWTVYIPFSTEHLCYADREGWRRVYSAEGFVDGALVGPHGYYFTDEGEVFSSDGTNAGTVRRFQLPPPIEGARLFAGDDAHLYFELRIESAFEIWTTPHDGSAVEKIRTYSGAGAQVLAFEPLGERSTWLLSRSDGGRSLWRSDGTRTGTRRLFQFENRSEGVSEVADSRFTSFGGRLFFPLSNTGGDGFELWSTDGSAASTVRQVEISAPEGAHPGFVYATPAGLFFTVTSDTHERALWRSDGSQAGTWRVADDGPWDVWWGAAAWLRDRLVFLGWGSEAGIELWESYGTPGATGPLFDLRTGPESSEPRDFARVGDRLFFVADDGVHGRELWYVDAATERGCPESDDVLCTSGGRFRWLTGWRDFEGNQGLARALESVGDSGLLWFFDPANLELAVKALDASEVNGRTWVFLGSLSNVEFSTTIVDVETEAARTYVNPAGHYASFGDTAALPALERWPRSMGNGAPFTEAPPSPGDPPGICFPSATRICLFDDRFAVEATWRDFAGQSGVGRALPLTADTGGFWFFAESNLEVVLKVLDGRPINDRFWVYYGALSNVEYILTVTDTATGAVRTYVNPAGLFASQGDTEAF